MQLTVLGCSGSAPGPDLPTSGYLVEVAGVRIAVELGGGVFGALQRRCDPFTLDAVLLSHLHLDHCADFSALTTYLRAHPAPPASFGRLPVFAPPHAPDRLAAAHAASEEELATLRLADTFDFVPLAAGTFHVGPVTVEVAAMRHICEAYAFRISHGDTSLVFTGDTVPCPELVALARGADLLLADAAWREQAGRANYLHMSGRETSVVATEAGVGRLVLTHVLPWSDRDGVLADATEAFAGPVNLARPGDVYQVRVTQEADTA
ncbi:MBL fold metallo-hydrolase [Actinosynnema sp. NPDC047251]|uniref:Beta-lactamase domain protein n=1 Tax=Saccharothrix espanaensis (strain ATCC 51144 / DSM 44229 / JCM 9112 / NBRC 15066 / NRRL 15764) TaxID=1179773 RepID=K0JSK6_SACES|nr:MBL fold metallo-hydrolase [Saccharothrix espanaensis]CCH28497.1 beta-lactamase domain protein [Saccharothrix espanaensis DSM 44229]